MKKYIEFVLALLLLLASIGAGLFVFAVSYQNGGDFFGRNADERGGNTITFGKAKKTGTEKEMKEDESLVTGTVFIGDSRFVGMDQVVDIENRDRQFVVARVGQGLSWFKKSALERVERIRDRNTGLTKWRYVICLGVNDIKNIKNYLKEYDELLEDDSVELVLVSVNPVRNFSAVTNEEIEDFNEKLKAYAERHDLLYIDSYSKLMDEGYETTDGLHYSKDTYRDIYTIIEEGLNKGSSD